eukprot:TRINITY_DN3660_c0_g1_i7.p1 TRINITY_DN3660_c0_g1~~TRINITY_DN3660_c0_g1_i7.p1  ORF type:complete len:308 (-),score=23.10 TRINITY_DN3660_c0_g1_i7:64-987(-)
MPGWIYFLNAVCLFFYQTLDALDGKQARRTNNSSPLGELFDHGCDAMTTVFQALTLYGSCRIGLGWIPFVNLLILLSTFYVNQWEVYFTGTLQLWYINVSEAQVFGILAHLVGFVFGSNVWMISINLCGYDMYLMNVTCLVPMGFSCLLFIVSLYGMMCYCQANPKYSKSACLYLLPMVWLLVVSVLWGRFVVPLSSQKTGPLSLPLGLWWLICIGFILANMISKLCVCRVCKVSFHIEEQWLLFVPLLGLINSVYGFLPTPTLLHYFTPLAVISYIFFAISLIRDMTTFLEIYALKINLPKKKTHE